MSDAENFLRALWGTKPSQPAIQLWRRADHKSFYLADITAAVDWVTGNSESDIYMAAGLASKAQTPNKKRTTANSIVGIPGVWADIDVIGGPESKTNAARDIEEAQKLAEEVLQPTLLVHSGYGLQAWWLFESLWLFQTEQERTRAAEIVQGFQGALKSKASDWGFSIDSTFDLARLMRVPGGFNHKGPEPQEVEIMDDGGPRFSIDDIEEISAKHKAKAIDLVKLRNGDGVSLVVNPDAQVSYEKLHMALEVDDGFKKVWERKVKNNDPSSVDMSLTNYFVEFGWTDQEIVDALVMFRRMYFPDKQKLNRPDYYKRTIGKVRATRISKDIGDREDVEREEAEEELAAIVPNAREHPGHTLSLFNRVVGGPKIKNLMQHGTDYDTARVVLVMENGDEITLGKIDNLLELRNFKPRFAAKTQHICKSTDAKRWTAACQALLNTATIVEDKDETREALTLQRAIMYAKPRLSSHVAGAVESGDPIDHNDYVWIDPTQFTSYLKKQVDGRIVVDDVRVDLRKAGFEKVSISYDREDGRRTTCSRYYRIHKERLDGEGSAESAIQVATSS